MDRYSRLFPYRHGERIEIEQVKSGDHAKPKHRRTLFSLGLGGVGDTSVVEFNDSKVGELHSVNYLVRVLTPPPDDLGSAKARRVRVEAVEEVQQNQAEVEAVIVTTYDSSGGESQVLGVEGGGLFRIEIQKGGFALMWPSPLGFDEFLARAQKLWWSDDDGRVSIFPVEGEPMLDRPASSLPERWETDGSPEFVRIDFGDRSMTWADAYGDPDRVDAPADYRPNGAHEVSIAGADFDSGNITKLVRETATELMAELSEQLTASAAKTLSR